MNSSLTEEEPDGSHENGPYDTFVLYKPYLYAVTQLACLIWMRPKSLSSFQRLVPTLPFYIQVAWSLAGIFFTIYFNAEEGSVEYQVAN